MIKITLDTSCIDKRVTKELNELKKLYEENKIQVWMFEASFWEKMQYKNRILQLRDLAWMMSFIDEDRYAHEIPKGKTIDDVEPFDREKYGQIYKKVSEIHSPEFKGGSIKHLNDLDPKTQFSKHHDWQILTKCIIMEHDYFVTLNTNDFIKNGKRETFEEEFDIQIRELNGEFINELKNRVK